MKRLSILLLVFILITMSFSACGTKANDTAKTNTAVSAATAAPSAGGPLFKDKVTFTMMTSSNASWPYDPNWWIWKAIEQATNVKLDTTGVLSSSYPDKLTLTMASGNIPDLLYINDYALRNKYAAAGAFVEINKNLNAKTMPNFYKFYSASKENQAWVKRFVSGDGKLYAVPNYGYGEGNRCSFFYREDVFKKNNIAVPKTYDELYNACKKLKDIYPDSYPFVFRSAFATSYMNRLNLLANQWGTGYPYYFDDKSSTWKFGPADSSFKEFTMWLNKMYKEKLMPMDILTLQTQQWEELVSRGKSFISLDYVSRIQQFNNAGRPDNAEYTMKYMAPPAGGKDGKAKFEFTAVGNATIAISSTSKQIDKALAYLDWLYSDQAAELVSWGKEGETYKVVNGQREWIKSNPKDDVNKLYGIGTEGAYLMYKGSETFAIGAEKEYLEALKEGPKADDTPEPVAAFNDDESKINSMEGAAIAKYLDQEMTKFITGTRDFSEWDKFVDEVKKMGLDKVLKIYNDSYARSK